MTLFPNLTNVPDAVNWLSNVLLFVWGMSGVLLFLGSFVLKQYIPDVENIDENNYNPAEMIMIIVITNMSLLFHWLVMFLYEPVLFMFMLRIAVWLLSLARPDLPQPTYLR